MRPMDVDSLRLAGILPLRWSAAHLARISPWSGIHWRRASIFRAISGECSAAICAFNALRSIQQMGCIAPRRARTRNIFIGPAGCRRSKTRASPYSCAGLDLRWLPGMFFAAVFESTPRLCAGTKLWLQRKFFS
jgi:hypothetical protein